MPDNVKQGTVYMMVAFGVSSVIGYGSHVIIARTLGPEDYGLFGILLSCIAIAAGFGAGIPNAMVVFISKYEALNDKKMVHAIIKSGIKLQTFLILAFAAVALSLSAFLTSRFLNGSVMLFSAFVLVVPLTCFYGISTGILQGLREQKLIALIETLQNAFYFILILALFIVFGLGLKVIVGAYTSISLLLCVAGIVLVRLMLRDRSEKSQATDVMRVIKFALPSSLITIIGSLLMKSAPILVKALGTGDVDTSVGYTVLVLSLAGIPDRATRVVFRAGGPHMSRWHAQNNTKSLNSYTRRVILVMLLGCFLLVIGAHFFALPLIGKIYGRTYIPIIKYVIPTIVVFGTVSIANMYRAVMYAIGQPTRYLYLTIGSLVIYAFSIYLLKETVDVVMSVIFAIGFSNVFLIIGSMIVKRRILAYGELQ